MLFVCKEHRDERSSIDLNRRSHRCLSSTFSNTSLYIVEPLRRRWRVSRESSENNTALCQIRSVHGGSREFESHQSQTKDVVDTDGTCERKQSKVRTDADCVSSEMENNLFIHRIKARSHTIQRMKTTDIFQQSNLLMRTGKLVSNIGRENGTFSSFLLISHGHWRKHTLTALSLITDSEKK